PRPRTVARAESHPGHHTIGADPAGRTFTLPPTARARKPTLFPYTTLFRSRARAPVRSHRARRPAAVQHRPCKPRGLRSGARRVRDRKSTRLNSSHLGISYAVFCL